MRKELETACCLAREAGGLIMEIYNGEGVQAEWKNPTEPITLADRVANSHIVTALQREFPLDGILAEESVDDGRRLLCERVWMIDPLDGTKEFIKRNGEFSVMIGLAVRGVPVLGVVYKPVDDLLYFASAGGGAFVVREGGKKRLSVSAVRNPSQMRLVVSRSHKEPFTQRISSELGIENEIQSGSVGLKVGLITEKQCDLYIHPSGQTRLWDTCAPDILLREAGGHFTDLQGDSLKYDRADIFNRTGVLASNGQSHEKIVNTIYKVSENLVPFN